MQRDRGLTGRRGPGHGERLALSVALVAVSLLWLTTDTAVWARVLCVIGAAGGAAGACYFGWRLIRSRS